MKLRTIDLDKITLQSGGHQPDSKFCVVELAAFIAGEPWSDHPKCVSPSIAAFLRSWNDSLDDETRQILKPYAVKCIGTKGTDEHEEIRAWMATDWLVREYAPAWLRLAGLTKQAEALESLAALTGKREAKSVQPIIEAARKDAAAAGYATWAAAGAAAGIAARAATWYAARDAAGAATWDAAGAAARAAAKKKLAPTIKALQQSALLLLDRMIEVHHEEYAEQGEEERESR